MIEYFAIRVTIPNHRMPTLFYQEEKDELFLSPHLRLCGFNAMAHIRSELLANQFIEACLPLLIKRYQKDVHLEVGHWQSSDNKRLLVKIEKDSEVIQERISTGNFAPNKL